MRRFLCAALSLSLLSTARPCNAENSDGKQQGCVAPTPATAGDPSDCIVKELFKIANDQPTCCADPCRGLAARISAIDTLGGFKTTAAVKKLDCLLKGWCTPDSKKHCACDDYSKTLLALHAIQALEKIGSPASLALPSINSALCLSGDLAGPIANAVTAIQTPPPVPKPDPATKAKLDKLVKKLEKAELALCHGCPCKVEKLIQDVKHEVRKLETPPAKCKP